MFNRGGGRDGGGRKVCDFFLQGRCKFGDACKYEHPAQNNNRFSALSNGGSSGGRGRADAIKDALPYHLNREVMIADLKTERPQWPFSAYGPGRDAPRQLLGGFPLEQSPEEMRVLYYLAQSSGNPQPAVESEQQLFVQMNQQVEKVLADPDGAVKYVLDGDNEHPNRRDLTKASGQQNDAKAANPFSAGTTTSAFGQPSAMGGTTSTASPFGGVAAAKPANPFGSGGSTFGQPSQAGNTSAFGQPSQPGHTSAFGQPSQPGPTSAFGQPSQPGTTSAFGQPSQPGTTSPFGQPSQISARSAFGQPSQPGPTSAFGQPSQPGATSAFGQPSQPGTSSGFGQPSALGGGGGFGQPSALGQNKPAFGQPSQAGNAFSNPQTTSAFGQPSQPNQASPFAAAAQSQQPPGGSPFGAFGQPSQPSQSPFAATASNQQKPSPFAQATPSGTASNPFSQASQPSASPFAQAAPQQSSQPQANTSAVKSPFSPPHTHPAVQTPMTAPSQPGSTASTATPAFQSYAQVVNGRLRSFKGKPVTYIDNIPYYSRTGNTNNPSSLERIFCPEGPPPGNKYTAESDELYAKIGLSVERQYMTCAEQGRFEGGIPMLAPRREWVRFDL